MKMGGDSLSFTLDKVISFKIGSLTLVGFVLYIFSFLLWQRLVVSFDLTYIVPLTAGIVQIVVLLIGHFVFHESISLINIIGIFLITFGVIMVSLGRN